MYSVFSYYPVGNVASIDWIKTNYPFSLVDWIASDIVWSWRWIGNFNTVDGTRFGVIKMLPIYQPYPTNI